MPLIPGHHLDNGHLDQGFKAVVCRSLIDHALLQQGVDQRQTSVAGTVLDFQRPGQLFFADGAGADQNLADAYAAVQVVGADQVPLVEHQLTLAPLAGKAQHAALAGPVQQLDDIDDGKMLQIACK